MYFNITHATKYHYSEPAWDSFNELHLRPSDDYRQTVLKFDLKIQPKPEVRSHRDYYTNLLHHFHLPKKHNSLRIEATSRVVTYPVPAPHPVSARALPELRHRLFEYIAPTERVPLDRDWFSLFGGQRPKRNQDLVEYLVDLNDQLHKSFVYDPGSTHLNTPLADFANDQRGVCQDFAHAMLALCRSAGVPTRYVSGYIHSNPNIASEELLGAEASHAWVEAFLPGSGWVGFDPTNGCLINEAHVKIGYGRDYDDVSPVRGLRRGGGQAELHVEVKVRKHQPTSKA